MEGYVGESDRERLCQFPLRQRVRREALVEDADRRLEPRILQIRIEIRQHAGHHHALVADRCRRQAGDVGVVPQRILGTATAKEQSPVEATSRHAFGRIDEELFDPRQRPERELAADRRIDRHSAPAGEFEAGPMHGVFEDLARELIERLRAGAGPGDLEDLVLLKARICRLIESEIRVSGPLQVTSGQRRLVALVGPTGVGKTTTIAKLAANFHL